MLDAGSTLLAWPPFRAGWMLDAGIILPNRLKHVQYEAIRKGPSAMRDVGRDHHRLARAQNPRFAVDGQLQASVENIRHLLVHMKMFLQRTAGFNAETDNGNRIAMYHPGVKAGHDLHFRNVVEIKEPVGHDGSIFLDL